MLLQLTSCQTEIPCNPVNVPEHPSLIPVILSFTLPPFHYFFQSFVAPSLLSNQASSDSPHSSSPVALRPVSTSLLSTSSTSLSLIVLPTISDQSKHLSGPESLSDYISGPCALNSSFNFPSSDILEVSTPLKKKLHIKQCLSNGPPSELVSLHTHPPPFSLGIDPSYFWICHRSAQCILTLI